MKYEEWRKLYMKGNSIEEIDLEDDPEWEKEIKTLYEKAREVK